MSCGHENKDQTIIAGTATILVDETIFPIVEDLAFVFESQYNAKLNLISKPENEIINLLLNDSSAIAMLPRKLTPKESKHFEDKQIEGRITLFAVGAIAFVVHPQSKDSIIDLEEIINLLQGKKSKISGLIFENPNSSSVKFLYHMAKVEIKKSEGIYFLDSYSELINYISENPKLVGVVGLNRLAQPEVDQSPLKKIRVCAVKNGKGTPNDGKYYKPTQANLGAGLYPLPRELYMLNYQGSAGLGMGFASFIAGDKGQRIILKSGLLPVRIPSRSIITRSKILTTN